MPQWVGNMDERTTEISELYTRILQLERLQLMHNSADTTNAIQHHLDVLRKRLLELTRPSIARTIA